MEYNKHYEKQGAVGSDIINEVNHYIPRSILDHNININNYKEYNEAKIIIN